MSNTTYIEEVLANHKDWFEAIETMTSSLPTDEWELLNDEIKGMFKQMLTQAIRDTEVKTAVRFKELAQEYNSYVHKPYCNWDLGYLIERIDKTANKIINTNQED